MSSNLIDGSSKNIREDVFLFVGKGITMIDQLEDLSVV